MSAKYQKRPIVIEAFQWWPDMGSHGGVYHENPDDDCGLIDTLEGRMMVSAGDWIITGIKGELYPCKPDIFEATYEAVEDVAEPQLDWPKAKAYLDEVQKRYEELPGGVGRLGLYGTIMPLQGRYEHGERTKWLYDEIMEVE